MYRFVRGSLVAIGLVSASVSAAQVQPRHDYVAFWKALEGEWQTSTERDGETVKGTYAMRAARIGRAYLSHSTRAGEPEAEGLHAYDPATKCWKVVQVDEDGSRTTSLLWVANMDEVFPLGSGSRGIYQSTKVAPDGTMTHTQGDWLWREFDGQQGVLVLDNTRVDGQPQPNAVQSTKRVR
jgi:hypothetical protein